MANAKATVEYLGIKCDLVGCTATGTATIIMHGSQFTVDADNLEKPSKAAEEILKVYNG